MFISRFGLEVMHILSQQTLNSVIDFSSLGLHAGHVLYVDLLLSVKAYCLSTIKSAYLQLKL